VVVLVLPALGAAEAVPGNPRRAREARSAAAGSEIQGLKRTRRIVCSSHVSDRLVGCDSRGTTSRGYQEHPQRCG
jgi:hypothetical protein